MIKNMNFNPMDLIHVKEHFQGCFDEREVSKFINILIELQCDGVLDETLKENLGEYFFAKQEMIDQVCKFGRIANGGK